MISPHACTECGTVTTSAKVTFTRKTRSSIWENRGQVCSKCFDRWVGILGESLRKEFSAP